MLRLGVIILAFLSASDGTEQKTQTITIPLELQITYMSIQDHFCKSFHNESCSPGDFSGQSICCRQPNECYNTGTHDSSVCKEGNQTLYCGYQDAIVCQNNEMTGSCIYSASLSTQPLCACKNPNINKDWQNSPLIKRSCRDDGTTIFTTRNQASITHPPSTISTGQLTTTDGHGPDSSTGQVNVVAIILVIILSLVLTVIIAAVFLRRRGKLPAWLMAPKPREPSTVESQEMSYERPRLQTPEPPVPNRIEFAYVYANWPSTNPTELDTGLGEPEPVNHAGNEYHSYVNVKEKQQKDKFVKHGQVFAPSGTGPVLPAIHVWTTSQEGSGRPYFPLLPTPKFLTQNENSVTLTGDGTSAKAADTRPNEGTSFEKVHPSFDRK